MKTRMEKEDLIQKAIDWTLESGHCPEDEERLAHIEALLRDALGQNHGVWRWRVGRKEWSERLFERMMEAGDEQ